MILFLTLSVTLAAASAQDTCTSAATFDEPRTFLVTTSPGQPLFSVFGHSALWLSGGDLARPVVVDWGHYSGGGSTAITGFLSGEARYTLEASTPTALVARARHRDRTSVAQRLDLPPAEVEALHAAALEALRAEDRSFAYDWLRDNCATRIRDILDLATDGAVSQQAQAGGGRSARHEILRHLGAPQRGLLGGGLWLGWHVMAPGSADQPLTDAESLFLPDRLMQGMRSVQRTWPDGSRRPLVAEECVLHDGRWAWVPGGAPSWGLHTLGVGLAWAVGVAAGLRCRLLGGGAVGLLGLVAGLVGSITVVLALTSNIDALRNNHSWWLLSPASLLLLPVGVGLARDRVRPWHAVAAALLATSALIGSSLSLAGLVEQVLWPTPALIVPPLLATVGVLVARLRRAR